MQAVLLELQKEDDEDEESVHHEEAGCAFVAKLDEVGCDLLLVLLVHLQRI